MPHTLLTTLTANVPSGAWTGSTVPFHEARLEQRHVQVAAMLARELPGGRCVKVGKIVNGAGFAVIIESLDGAGDKSSLVFGLTPDAAEALTECLIAQLSNGEHSNTPTQNT